MSHTHHYRFWHAHTHRHMAPPDGSPPITWEHNTGHYHNWMQTHDHGGGADKTPHTHKDKQYHPTDDKVTKHHHALDAHDTEEEGEKPCAQEKNCEKRSQNS